MGCELIALSGRSFSRHVRPPHFASKVSYSAAPQSRARKPNFVQFAHPPSDIKETPPFVFSNVKYLLIVRLIFANIK